MQPWIHASGAVLTTDGVDKFDLEPQQYTAAFKVQFKRDPSISTLPIACWIPDSPRYKNSKKPCPRASSNLSLEGHITEVVRTEEGAALRFKVNVHSVSFMGRVSVPPKVPATPSEWTSVSCDHITLSDLRYNDRLSNSNACQAGLQVQL